MLIPFPDYANALDITLRLFSGALLSGIIGIERDIHGRAAGLRTNILISLGAASFMILSESIVTSLSVNYDPTRIAAQVVSGIGFLGAGAIIKNEFTIRGLTTAASIWISSAIGLACGAGHYFLALTLTALSLFSLVALERLERHYAHDYYRLVIIETADGVEMSRLAEILASPSLRILACETAINYETHRQTMRFTVRLREREQRGDIASVISERCRLNGIPLYHYSLSHQ